MRKIADVFLGEYRSLEDAMARCVLKAVMTFNGEAGGGFITDLLKGSLRSSFLDDWSRVGELFGVLSSINKKNIRTTIDGLMDKDYISNVPGTKLLSITPKGVKALNTDRAILVSPAFEIKPVKIDVPEDIAIYHSLKEVRDEIARDEGIPPYRVLPNRSLLEMALNMPETEKEMLSIYGIGEVKFRKYGKRFLKEIKKHM